MPPTKAGRGGVNINFEMNMEGVIRPLLKSAENLKEFDTHLNRTMRSASKYVEDVLKPLKELTTVSDKLPATAKSIKTVFESLDGLRVNQNKAQFLKDIAGSLSKFYVPLQVLGNLNIAPGVTQIDNLFTVLEKVPTKAKIDRLQSLGNALKSFSSGTKSLGNIPSINLQNLGGMGFLGGGGGRGPGGGGASGGPSGGTGGGSADPKYVWNAMTMTYDKVKPPVEPPISMWEKAENFAATKGRAFGMRALLAAPLISMLNERSAVNEQLGTGVDFNLGLFGMGGTPGSMEKQAMLDRAGMLHGISYRDAASLMTSYRKYSSGGFRPTSMTELSSADESGVRRDFEGYVANSRRLQRQLGIDLDAAGDIQGSSRKNLGLNARQFREFGDSMVYLSRNAAMSKREIIDLSKEIQTVGIVTGRTGDAAKTFAQNMMAAGGTLSEIGVSGAGLSSMQKGFTGDMTNYLLNKQMGVTSGMTAQQQVMAQQQFVASRLQGLAGMDPETRALMISMMQSKGLLPAEMSVGELTKLAQADPATIQKRITEHSKKITEEQTVQGMSTSSWWGSALNVAKGYFGKVTNSNPAWLISPAVNLGRIAYDAWSSNREPTEKKAAGGIVGGSGETDSVRAMLTPGEEVLRKDDPRHRDNIGSFSRAIAQIEGYYADSDSPNRPQRNLNPGNLRVAGWRSGMSPAAAMSMAKTQGAIGYDKGGYLKFASEAAGFAGLERQIRIDAKRGLNVGQFVSKYAPATENNTANYLSFIGRKGFGAGLALSDITGEGGFSSTISPTAVAATTSGGILDRVRSTFSSMGSSISSFIGNLFDFSSNASSAITKSVQGNTAQVSSALLGASSSNNESADKISQAADVLLQAAHTMSNAVVSQTAQGNAEQRARIASIARGNMVF